MADIEQREREEIQRSRLNAGRYSKQKLQQKFRGSLFKEDPNKDQSEDIPEESRHKNRLELLKAGAIKNANAEAGGAVGATVGGAVGSAIPIIGTGFGAVAGRFLGRKVGITKIVVYSTITLVISSVFFIILFIAIMKGTCDYIGLAGRALDYFTTNICPSLK